MSRSSSKKGLKIFLFLVLAAIAVTAVLFFSKAKAESEAEEMFTMPTNAQRVDFLNRQGWIVKPDPILREEAVMPSEFDGAYAEYIALQLEQGFDLKRAMGKKAVVIKYQVLNYPDHPENVVATMIICDDCLIGGDISMTGEGGFMEALVSAAAQTYLEAELLENILPAAAN